jgi:hypothetical protein
MLTGWNDWDQLLEEKYQSDLREGRVFPPKPQPTPTLEQYGQSVTFTLEEILGA